MPSYNPADIERHWQAHWARHKTFRTPDEPKPGQTKKYVLDMFPYPSGAGLHVGHPEGYTATDILCRYYRMRGFHVLHPMGWDAFGLPAEQYAIENNVHPRNTTKKNIDTFRRQIQALGFSYDWDREVDTTDPAYFKWTQWIFLVLFDTWYDPEQKKGRPISELPLPGWMADESESVKRKYIDGHRLAYQADVPVNWCPALGTVLANEEVIDGKSDRGSHPVERRPLRQWLMRITAYAERLLEDLEPLNWSESIKHMQWNWIGRSEGAEVDFPVALAEGQARASLTMQTIRVFTTRPDTLFGATYMVLAPDHPLVDAITTKDQRADVMNYQAATARKSEFERTEMAKTKTGVFTGAFAYNPASGETIPIWIADYVLSTYGTGAIMAVPGHDKHDFEFATQYILPIKTVVQPPDAWLKQTGSTLEHLKAAFTDDGVAVNSGPLDGFPTPRAKEKMIARLEAQKAGERKINFKLRDWLFSRQRYWGEPFPILHELGPDGKRTGAVRALTLSDLPVRLPELEDYKPTGSPEGPLLKAKDWINVTLDGKQYIRETNTMPQWAGSCWYYLRYIDPKNDRAFADPAKLRHWLPIDLYVGGAEHAVLHLLYSRFWHKVLYDRGYVPCPEPFQRLVNQGMILGEFEYHITAEYVKSVQNLGYAAVPVPDSNTFVVKDSSDPIRDEQTEKKQGKTYLKGTQIELQCRAEKMSKSRGNVINPDDVIREYGADSLRLYEMFMGPLEAVKPWSMNGVEGVHRFLGRVWRLIVDDGDEMKLHSQIVNDVPAGDVLREMHRTIQKVSEDTDSLRFNTAISAMMEFTNLLTKQEKRPKAALETLVLLLSPYAPHLAEELWRLLGHSESLAYAPWPVYDPALLKSDTLEIPVSINGKLKCVIQVATAIEKDALELAAKADPKIAEALAGKTIKKSIVVPKKMVNFVIG